MGGVTPYLEVLDSDRQLFESELWLTQDRANEFLAVTALYRALGGDWQTQDAPWHIAAAKYIQVKEATCAFG
jgi:outer membrane protein, multidrug efflux system